MTVGGMGSIPGPETKILYAGQWSFKIMDDLDPYQIKHHENGCYKESSRPLHRMWPVWP